MGNRALKIERVIVYDTQIIVDGVLQNTNYKCDIYIRSVEGNYTEIRAKASSDVDAFILGKVPLRRVEVIGKIDPVTKKQEVVLEEGDRMILSLMIFSNGSELVNKQVNFDVEGKSNERGPASDLLIYDFFP